MITKLYSWVKKRPCLTTALLLSLSLLPWLWGRGLQNPDETRYGAIALEMFNSNDFIIPHLNGVPYLEKPPLLYWLGAISIWLIGPNEGGLRIWPFLSGLSIAALSAFVATRFYGRVAGLNAGLIAATTLFITVFGQVFNIDLLVSCLITASLMCFLIGATSSEKSRKTYFILVYLFCALAVLAKGLIGVILPSLVILTWCIITHRLDVLRACISGLGLMLFFSITIPWHYFVAIRHENFFEFYFINEHFRRFTTNIHHRNQSPWFPLIVLSIGMLPWTGYLYGVVQNAIKNWRCKNNFSEIDNFFILWSASIFLFFSFSHSQLPGYFLPLIAPLSILIGKIQASPENRVINSIGLGISFFTMLSLAFLTGPLSSHIPFSAQYIGTLGYFRWVLSGAALIAATGFLWQLISPRRNNIRIVIAYLPFLFSLNYGTYLIQPKSIKHLILSNKSIIQNHPIAIYKTYILDTNFYLNRPAIFIDIGGELENGLSIAPRPELFLTSLELSSRLQGSQPIFIVLREDRLPELPSLKIIDRQGDIILATKLEN